jgi:hypothetical protein
MKAVGAATRELVSPRSFFGGRSFRQSLLPTDLCRLLWYGTYAVVNLSELALDVPKYFRVFPARCAQPSTAK